MKTALFQAIQFSISTQFSSIWSIYWTLSGATFPGKSEPGSDGNQGYYAFPKAPGLLEHLPEIVKCHIQESLW